MLNKYIVLTFFFIVLQQFILGISTYSIAKAGSSLGQGDSEIALRLIIVFFCLSLLAFFISMIATIFVALACKKAASHYIHGLIELAHTRPLAGSSVNKQKTASWISGEAIGTIDDLLAFATESLSITLNLAFTLVVFFIVLGLPYGMGITLSIAASILIIYFFRARIGRLGSTMQKRLLSLNTTIPRVWDGLFSGNDTVRKQILADNALKFESYYATRQTYILTEQALAALPILISVLFIIGILLTEGVVGSEKLVF